MVFVMVGMWFVFSDLYADRKWFKKYSVHHFFSSWIFLFSCRETGLRYGRTSGVDTHGDTPFFGGDIHRILIESMRISGNRWECEWEGIRKGPFHLWKSPKADVSGKAGYTLSTIGENQGVLRNCFLKESKIFFPVYADWSGRLWSGMKKPDGLLS